MSLAFLYAGQGSQHPGMGADLYEAHPAFRAVLDAAGVDFDLKTTMFTDPDGVLNLTEYTQPCKMCIRDRLGATPSIPATAFSVRTPTLPTPARPPASPSSAPPAT